MAAGYIRQSSANIQSGLPIQSADINNEFNQVQSAFDNTTGHDHTGSASGTGSKIILTTSVTGALPVANGGTGLASGTSGGVPYFSGTTTLASSALLTNNALMLGGGAAAAPKVVASLGTTTTVLHGNAAGAPTFGAVTLTTDVTGTLPIANGGTGSSSTAFCSLTTNVSGTLPTANGGTGSSSTAYCNLAANVSGALPVVNGGTGVTQLPNFYTNVGTPFSYSTASASLLMAGFSSGTTIVTPRATGRILFIASGTVTSTLSTAIVSVTGRYTSGNGPATNAAVTGTASTGDTASYIPANSAVIPFTLVGIVTGLTLATSYWFDLAVSTTLGTASIANITFSVVEF